MSDNARRPFADLKRAVADLTERVETLEMALNPGATMDNQCACGDAHVDTCQGCKVDTPRPDRQDYLNELMRRVPPDPAPVPEWRRLVDKWHIDGSHGIGAAGSPLAAVLWLLHHLAIGSTWTCQDDLARIVAVCEAQVGDGWQVDPDLIRIHHKDGRARCDVECLIDALARDEEARWIVLAGRAARWLRDLTEDAS